MDYNLLLYIGVGLMVGGFGLWLFSEMRIIEDLSKSKNSDKFQYIFPNFNNSKLIDTGPNINGNLNYSLSGSNIKKDTNVEERNLANNMNYKSKSLYSSFGSVSNFEIFLKNSIKKGKNSSTYEDKTQSRNNSLITFNSSLPLEKRNSKYVSYLTPKMLLMFNPDDSVNISNSDRKINNINLFSYNRLGLSDSFEGDKSVTLGIDYRLNDMNNNDLLSFNLGQIFKDKNNKKLPKKSTLQNKSSDLLGALKIKPNENFNLNYNFSADNNLDTINSSKINGELKINNFYTFFEFLEENNDIGTNSYMTNNVRYNFNNKSSLLFNTRRNRKTDLTEFYDLIYEYRNDCLIAAIEYNKDYYQDRDLKPNESIIFKLTITPFASVNTPSIK